VVGAACMAWQPCLFDRDQRHATLSAARDSEAQEGGPPPLADPTIQPSERRIQLAPEQRGFDRRHRLLERRSGPRGPPAGRGLSRFREQLTKGGRDQRLCSGLQLRRFMTVLHGPNSHASPA
jgi:hypothetical protein